MSTTPDNKYGIDDALKQEEQEHPARAAMSRRTFAKVAGVSAAALAIGGSWALAWFTGRDTKVNKVSIANGLSVRVVEPAWVPENAVHVVAGQHLPKDPRIENLSDEFAGWMVVEIRVPTAVVSVFDETEQKVLDPARTPLFSFVADPKWTLLQQFEDGDEDVYRFGWPETIPALGQTPPIFEEVVMANLVETQGQSGSKTITAAGYGIQSEGLPDIATAWDAYKKQNGIGDGKPAEIPPVQWIRVKNGFSNLDRDPKNPNLTLAGTSFENSFGPLGDGGWDNTWYSLYSSAKSRWTGLPTCSSDVWGYSVHRCSSNYAENRKAEFPSNHVSGMTNNGVVCAVHYSDLSVIFIMPITYSKCSIEMPEQEKLTLLTRISGKPVYGYFSEKLSPVPIA